MDDVKLALTHPKKAFMVGALEKEIRLSFAQRIRGTLPEPYQPLISEAKEKDTPDFKYNSDGMTSSSLLFLSSEANTAASRDTLLLVGARNSPPTPC